LPDRQGQYLDFDARVARVASWDQIESVEKLTVGGNHRRCSASENNFPVNKDRQPPSPVPPTSTVGKHSRNNHVHRNRVFSSPTNFKRIHTY
jgi:hypothetical protein